MSVQFSSIPAECDIAENVLFQLLLTAVFLTFTRSFKGVEHEGAYNTSPQAHPQQMFALWAITNSWATSRARPPWNTLHEGRGGNYRLRLIDQCVRANSAPHRIGEKAGERNDDGYEDPCVGRYLIDMPAVVTPLGTAKFGEVTVASPGHDIGPI